jgi:hypothetical protein
MTPMTSIPASLPSTNSTAPPRDRVLWLVTFLVAAAHLAVAGRYDFFRDELYFIICGRHPDFGYVDQPPLVPLLAALTQVLGENLWLLRVPAALAAAALVPLTAALARLFGGNRGAALLAGIAAGIAPVLAGLSATLFTSSFDGLAWTGLAYFLARAVLRDDGRALLWAGLIAGLAFETKYGIVLWFLGLALGIAATPERRILARKSLWYGVALAAIIAAPNLAWQTAHGWPFLEVTRNHSRDNLTGSPMGFVVHQIFIVNPFLAPLWIAGLVAPFVRTELKAARFVAIAFLAAATITFAAHGKDYYLAGAYPTLFAIGAVVAIRAAFWLRTVVMAGALAIAAVAAPIVLPILPPDVLIRYMDATHLRPRPNQKSALDAPITQLFSDQFGWREFERRVAAIHAALPPDERAHAAILAANYGEAAALDFYGKADGLPPAIGGQDQYFLWGPRGADGRVIIHVNGDSERWRSLCASLDIAGTFGAPYAMPYENQRPILVCRGFRADLAAVWGRFKRFY